MTYTTSVFTYTQREIVVLLTAGEPARKFVPVYSKPLSLQRGTDNQLQFQLLNQDQKPQDITGKSITCRIISADGTEILLQKALVSRYALTGIATLELSASDIQHIPAQKANYSLTISDSNSTDMKPLYMDQNSDSRGQMIIHDSVFPTFIPSAPISIPSSQAFPNANPLINSANPLPTPLTYYSSVVQTSDKPMTTIQTSPVEYTGNVTIQGSSTSSTDEHNWYDISNTSHANTSANIGSSIAGFHPFIRLKFTSTTGDITEILYR